VQAFEFDSGGGGVELPLGSNPAATLKSAVLSPFLAWISEVSPGSLARLNAYVDFASAGAGRLHCIFSRAPAVIAAFLGEVALWPVNIRTAPP
jgi:hypothetical protein